MSRRKQREELTELLTIQLRLLQETLDLVNRSTASGIGIALRVEGRIKAIEHKLGLGGGRDETG